MHSLTDEDVQEILRLLDGSSFDELHLETARFKLSLRRSGAGWTQERHTARPVAPPPAPSPSGEGERIGKVKTAAASSSGTVEVLPPIMGTFYRAPKPGAAPFVEVGAKVEPDTVVGIVETMKLMNSVYAGARGAIEEICAADGQLVEQGHVLMRIRPAAP
jgi:acetyl-CoA carboxylase biotin carboxyl carrier protein